MCILIVYYALKQQAQINKTYTPFGLICSWRVRNKMFDLCLPQRYNLVELPGSSGSDTFSKISGIGSCDLQNLN